MRPAETQFLPERGGFRIAAILARHLQRVTFGIVKNTLLAKFSPK